MQERNIDNVILTGDVDTKVDGELNRRKGGSLKRRIKNARWWVKRRQRSLVPESSPVDAESGLIDPRLAKEQGGSFTIEW